MRPKDVMAFVTAQLRPKPGAENVVRIADGSAGLSAANDQAPSGRVLQASMATRSPATTSRCRPTRCPEASRTCQSRGRNGRGLPLVRGVRRLPRILDPDEATRSMGALRTERDRAMTQAMVLGGLRRCEVLGLRLGDLRLGEWRVLIREGKGGHERLVPVSATFFSTVARYMDHERPETTSDAALSRVRKGAWRGQPLSMPGLQQIIRDARLRGRTQPRHLPRSGATPASPACAKPAWPSRPSRPRPDTAPSAPRGSICTWTWSGWPGSTDGPQKSSRPRRSSGWPNETRLPESSVPSHTESAGHPR